MKIHNKIYRSLTGEPFLTQDINGQPVEFFYLNDTPYLAQYVQKGRFYLWTSDGTSYRLLVEKGFYEKVSYFFTQDINSVWINFLDNVGKENNKMRNIFLFGSLGAMLVVILIAAFLNKTTYGFLIGLLIVLVTNMIHTSKINKLVKEKNYQAQMDIKDLLGEDGFNRLLNDQDEYAKEFFKFDDEEFDEEDEELESLDYDETLEDEVVEIAEEIEVLEEESNQDK